MSTTAAPMQYLDKAIKLTVSFNTSELVMA